MKILCISDTHNNHNKLTEVVNELIETEKVDVLVHAGDFSSKGIERQVRKFNNWMELVNLPKSHKIGISGNHDFYSERFGKAKMLIRCDNFIYLEGDSTTIDGVKFWGGPWTPWFFDWAFNVARGRNIKAIWDNIPTDTDVLITHGPPAYILDECPDGRKVGCTDLLNVITNDLDIKAHIFGHIHHSHGHQLIDKVHYVNASSMGEDYKTVNPPIIIEINKTKTETI